MESIKFFVPGEPRGKGRPRFNKKTGSVHTDSETASYEKKVVVYYRKAAGGFRFGDEDFLSVSVHALLPIPKSASKAKQAAMVEGKILPSRKPDIDNVLKIVLDSLNGVAYKDDARVVGLHGFKLYSLTPGIIVEITRMDGEV